MTQDEQDIRRWFSDWDNATRVGDLELARKLTADDAVFYMPGADPMGKDSYTAAATAEDPNLEFELDWDIQEIKVIGDYAWLISNCTLVMINKSTEKRSVMKGDSLTILQRASDGWVGVREANTIVSVEPDE